MDWQVRDMFILFIRDDQKRFSLGGSYLDSASWGITSIEGLGTIEYDITTAKNAVGDGDTVTGSRIPARNIDIVANVKNAKNNQIERRNALAFFNPKHDFRVYITRNSETRWISAEIKRVKCPDKQPNRNVEISIALLCVDPHFYSKDNFGKDIAAVKTTFGFPYISPISKGFNVGVYNFAKQVKIENTGDTETFLTIQILALGEVENPKIFNDSAYIRIVDSITSGDVIEIDLVNNKVRKNGQNCIGKLDRTSSFTGMVLEVGDNIISFGADSGDTNMKVVLYYNLRYLEA